MLDLIGILIAGDMLINSQKEIREEKMDKPHVVFCDSKCEKEKDNEQK